MKNPGFQRKGLNGLYIEAGFFYQLPIYGIRMLSLSIKLALARIIYNLKSEAPIVLLDDVLSELDINHQNRLLSMLDKKMQIIITTTDVTKIKDSFIKDAKIFNVVKGSVKEIQYGR